MEFFSPIWSRRKLRLDLKCPYSLRSNPLSFIRTRRCESLEMVLLIIISVQVLNGLANILTAINMRKHAKLQAEVRKLDTNH